MRARISFVAFVFAVLLVSVLGLTAIYQATTPAIPAAVVQYCGFSGLPQPQQEAAVGPNGQILPVEVWETWTIVPAEDDNPTDGLDAARCDLHFEITILGTNEADLVLNIHQDGPLGITAQLAGQAEILDDFATYDLIEAEGLKWIRDLRLRDRTFVKTFWITATRETAIHRHALTIEVLDYIIRDVADSKGIGEGFRNLGTPEELKDLPGTNYAQLREQCWRVSDMEGGTMRFSCARVVDIFIDDPSTKDAADGTIGLTIHPDRLGAVKHAGMFAVYEPGPDPLAVVEHYGLVNLVRKYCQLTKTVTFRINMYTGEVTDQQVTTCSQ